MERKPLGLTIVKHETTQAFTGRARPPECGTWVVDTLWLPSWKFRSSHCHVFLVGCLSACHKQRLLSVNTKMTLELVAEDDQEMMLDTEVEHEIEAVIAGAEPTEESDADEGCNDSRQIDTWTTTNLNRQTWNRCRKSQERLAARLGSVGRQESMLQLSRGWTFQPELPNEEGDKSSIPNESKRQCPSSHLQRRLVVQRRQNHVRTKRGHDSQRHLFASARDTSGKARSERALAETVQGISRFRRGRAPRCRDVLGVCHRSGGAVSDTGGGRV